MLYMYYAYKPSSWITLLKTAIKSCVVFNLLAYIHIDRKLEATFVLSSDFPAGRIWPCLNIRRLLLHNKASSLMQVCAQKNERIRRRCSPGSGAGRDLG